MKAEQEKKEITSQKTIDELLESQRDLTQEHQKQEVHLNKTHTDKIHAFQTEAEAQLESVGLEFEKKQSMLVKDHALEMENLIKKGQKHIKRAEKLEAEVRSCVPP